MKISFNFYKPDDIQLAKRKLSKFFLFMELQLRKGRILLSFRSPIKIIKASPYFLYINS